MYPDTCYDYNVSTPYEDRVQEVLSFFEGSPQDFPHLVTLYFDQPDRAGHWQGPFGDWVSKSKQSIVSASATNQQIILFVPTCINVPLAIRMVPELQILKKPFCK